MNANNLISVLVAAALFASVLGYQRPATYSKSGTKTVTLYNNRDFGGFPVDYTFVKECLDVGKVNAEPNPASSARLIRGGCVHLCNVLCEDKFSGVRGQCTELSHRNQMTEIKFLAGLNDQVRSIRSCSDQFKLTRNKRGTEKQKYEEHSNRYGERRNLGTYVDSKNFNKIRTRNTTEGSRIGLGNFHVADYKS